MTKISRVINREIDFDTLLNAQLDFSLVIIIFCSWFFSNASLTSCAVFLINDV